MAGEDVKNKYVIHKRLGETPLEALSRLRKDENIPGDVPMTYAGRLDPAAEGLLIVLAGEECKRKEQYSGLDKTYVAEMVFGVSTDTYDLLGVPTSPESMGRTLDVPAEADAYLKSHLGKQTQTYPPYSSKTVNGKQLHTHMKEGNTVELPSHEVELYEYADLTVGSRTREEILERVKLLTEIVTGDFRQKEILSAWTKLMENTPEEFCTIKVTLKVSSGFYIRQLAKDLGRALGTGACLYSLVRTEISTSDCIK